MKKITKFFPLLILSSGIYAAGNPSASCPYDPNFPGSGWCSFSNLQLYNNGQGQAAYFYCVADGPSMSGTVNMGNHAVLIGGFDVNGRLSVDVHQFNHYYFAAYKDPHDTDQPQVGVGMIRGVTHCYPGQGIGRNLYPGLPHSIK